jgi:hypothetical protein
MVLDTRTLDSLHDLAAVVQGYVSPGPTPARRSRTELTPEQKEDGCMMRYLHGWHVHHIVEALGIANANYSFNWEDNMTEALEECALSDYWNTQGLRLRPGAQISKEGPSQYGAARQSSLRNAAAEVLIADPKQRNARDKDKDGKDIPGTSLMDKAFVKIDGHIENGVYQSGYVKPKEPGRQNLNRYIRDLEALGFVWEGAGRRQIMADLPDDIRKAIDNEIRRQCRHHVAVGATIDRKGQKQRTVPINYSAIARDVYTKFPIDELDPESPETLASLGYPEIHPAYVRQLCQDAKITEDIRRPVKDQVADEANIKLVKDEREKDPKSSAWQIYQRTGLQLPVVERILDAQGLPRAGRGYSVGDIRAIILKAHDEKLTPQGMLDKHPELVEYFKDNVNPATEVIRQIIRRTNKTPHTDITLAAEVADERRIPLRAAQLKRVFIAHLRFWNEQELARIRGNLSRSQRPGQLAEESGHTIASLATRLNETVEFTQRALELLLAENMPLIALRGNDIVFPFTALRWITRGGEMLEGETG